MDGDFYHEGHEEHKEKQSIGFFVDRLVPLRDRNSLIFTRAGLSVNNAAELNYAA